MLMLVELVIFKMKNNEGRKFIADLFSGGWSEEIVTILSTTSSKLNTSISVGRGERENVCNYGLEICPLKPYNYYYIHYI